MWYLFIWICRCVFLLICTNLKGTMRPFNEHCRQKWKRKELCQSNYSIWTIKHWWRNKTPVFTKEGGRRKWRQVKWVTSDSFQVPFFSLIQAWRRVQRWRVIIRQRQFTCGGTSCLERPRVGPLRQNPQKWSWTSTPRCFCCSHMTTVA